MVEQLQRSQVSDLLWSIYNASDTDRLFPKKSGGLVKCSMAPASHLHRQHVVNECGATIKVVWNDGPTTDDIDPERTGAM
jgi:hypothetical protein